METFAKRLAHVWLSGAWTLEGLRERTLGALERERLGITLGRLVLGFWREFRDAPHRRRVEPIAHALEAHPRWERLEEVLWLDSGLELRAVMAAPPGDWALPQLASVDRLCAWLDVDPVELEWLQDRHGIAGHYHRHFSGRRLIEAPRRRLAAAQRRILRGLLDRVPAHEAAHAFRQKRSVLSAVRPHVGKSFVLVSDLARFFPSIRASRVHATFQRLGYPEDVARVLTQLTTCVTRLLPEGGEDRAVDAPLYRQRHLPQGAPTSPSVANLCAYRLDARLSGLAGSVGARYTRYADDLIFSGGVEIARGRFGRCVEAIVHDQGFEPNPGKTRLLPASTRQQVLGLVVNDVPSLPRSELARLEAIVFNCARHGPGSQHTGSRRVFRDHLAGRVAWAKFVNARKARRVVELFGAIDWDR